MLTLKHSYHSGSFLKQKGGCFLLLLLFLFLKGKGNYFWQKNKLKYSMLTKGKKVETFSYLTPLNLTQL